MLRFHRSRRKTDHRIINSANQRSWSAGSDGVSCCASSDARMNWSMGVAAHCVSWTREEAGLNWLECPVSIKGRAFFDPLFEKSDLCIGEPVSFSGMRVDLSVDRTRAISSLDSISWGTMLGNRFPKPSLRNPDLLIVLQILLYQVRGMNSNALPTVVGSGD